MPLVISCTNPACRQSMKVPDALVGKQVRCPKCQTVVAVEATAREPVGAGVSAQAGAGASAAVQTRPSAPPAPAPAPKQPAAAPTECPA